MGTCASGRQRARSARSSLPLTGRPAQAFDGGPFSRQPRSSLRAGGMASPARLWPRAFRVVPFAAGGWDFDPVEMREPGYSHKGGGDAFFPSFQRSRRRDMALSAPPSGSHAPAGAPHQTETRGSRRRQPEVSVAGGGSSRRRKPAAGNQKADGRSRASGLRGSPARAPAEAMRHGAPFGPSGLPQPTWQYLRSAASAALWDRAACLCPRSWSLFPLEETAYLEGRPDALRAASESSAVAGFPPPAPRNRPSARQVA